MDLHKAFFNFSNAINLISDEKSSLYIAVGVIIIMILSPEHKTQQVMSYNLKH